MSFKNHSNKLKDIQRTIKTIESQKIECEDLLRKQNKKYEALEHAQAFIQKVAQETQEQLRYQISDIVQLALDTCFPDEYDFEIKFEIKRGKTEANIMFLKNGHEIDPMEASGGGVVDLAAFALRIAAWSLGHSDNVIILDEPFRFLSKDLQPRAAEIMYKLSHQLKLQIIMVTHNQDIVDRSDRIFLVTKKKGVSMVTVKEDLK